MESNKRPLAVVTGASSGIGYELAKQFAHNGFDLFITAEDPGITTAAEKLRRMGGAVDVYQADLTIEESVQNLYEAITGICPRIDAIALNAGVGVGGPFKETNLQEELNMIRLNVMAPVHLAKLVLPGMLAQGSGRMLFTASIASTMPAPFEAVYGATKAFLLSFSEALRSELKDTNVTVTALMPGPTETNFFHRAGLDDTRVGVSEKDDPAIVAKDGFEAMMAGEAHVIGGGLKSKAMGLMNEIMPEQAKAAMHKRLAEPGSAHKSRH